MPPGESEGKACFAWRPEGTPQVMGSVGDGCCVESQVASRGFCMQGSDGQGVMWCMMAWVMTRSQLGTPKKNRIIGVSMLGQYHVIV